MNRTTLENVERILTPDLIRTAETGRFTLDVRTQLFSVLWLLATPDSVRSVSDRFGISKSMLHDSVRRIVAALNNLADGFIKWSVDDRLNEVKHQFSKIGSLPDVIGAIDGSHIPIPAPKINQNKEKRICHYTTSCMQCKFEIYRLFRRVPFPEKQRSDWIPLRRLPLRCSSLQEPYVSKANAAGGPFCYPDDLKTYPQEIVDILQILNIVLNKKGDASGKHYIYFIKLQKGRKRKGRRWKGRRGDG